VTVSQANQPALGFGDHLLSNDQNVTILQAQAGGLHPTQDHGREIVARFD